MNSDNLVKDKKYAIKMSSGRIGIVEYIGLWSNSFVFRFAGREDVAIFNTEEVATEIVREATLLESSPYFKY